MTPPRTRILTADRGFTMVELLVVILVIGILAMIALPAFLSQRSKGEDTAAQKMVRTAVTALATYHTDHETFDATVAQIVDVEPALKEARNLQVSGDEDSFEVAEMSDSGTTFTHARNNAGDTHRTCSNHGHGNCRGSADGAGNWW